MWNVWQMWRDEIIDDLPLGTNTMQQHVKIMTTATHNTASIFTTRNIDSFMNAIPEMDTTQLVPDSPQWLLFIYPSKHYF